jgi:hypothetical protein
MPIVSTVGDADDDGDVDAVRAVAIVAKKQTMRNEETISEIR